MKRSLTSQWGDHKKRSIKKITLEFTDYSKKEKSQITYALSFWSFCKEILNDTSVISGDQKNDFLKTFATNANSYVAIVAKMEMLPDAMFRKLLWRENIDFLSLESTLRRLSADQIEAINKAWSQLYEALEVPAVYKKTLRDYLMVVLGLITFGKISRLSNQNEYGERYLQKGAWLYNLALLDFGFGLYKNGTRNDEKLQHKNPLDFFMDPLRKKTHENDFWVNKEDGIYYVFYSFCRSWMFFRIHGSVQWQRAVCPAFWKTLLLNAWFFFGPLLALLLLVFKDYSTSMIIVIGVLAVPTLVWVVLALIILLIIAIRRLYDNQSEAIQTIGNMLLFIICIAAICFVGYWISVFMIRYLNTISNVYDVLEVSLSIVLFASCLYWAYSKILNESNYFLARGWMIKIFFFCLYSVFLVRVVQARSKIWQWLIEIAHIVKQWMMNLIDHWLIVTSITSLIVGFVVIVFTLITIFHDEEKFWARKLRYIGFFFASWIVPFYYIYNNSLYESMWLINIMAISFVVFSPTWFVMVSLRSDEIVQRRVKIRQWFNTSAYKDDSVPVTKLITKNQLAISMTNEEFANFLRQVERCVRSLFGYRNNTYAKLLISNMLHHGSMEIINLIKEHHKTISSLDDPDIVYCVRLLNSGLSFEQAFDKAYEAGRHRYMTNNQSIVGQFVYTIWGKMIIPIIWVFNKVIVPPCKFVFNLVGGLIAMAMTMRDACPMTNPEKRL